MPDLWPENHLALSVYEQWMGLSRFNERSMAGGYDFVALELILEVREIEGEEREEVLQKLALIAGVMAERE